jgi:ubiquinone/menaquinone biosynthesis C-methylase UbiE
VTLDSSSLRAYYDRKAACFDELALTYEHPSPYKRGFYLTRFQTVILALSPRGGEIILDVGAGTGFYSAAMSGYGAIVVAIDFSSEYVMRACSRSERTMGVVADAERMPFKTGTFDAILASEVIEHTARPRLIVCEIARVLVRNGRTVVTTPSRYSPLNLAYSIKRRKRKFDFNEHLCELTQKDLVALLNDHLHVESVDRCNHLLPYPLDVWLQRVERPWMGPIVDRGDRLLAATPLLRRAGWTMIARARSCGN